MKEEEKVGLLNFVGKKTTIKLAPLFQKQPVVSLEQIISQLLESKLTKLILQIRSKNIPGFYETKTNHSKDYKLYLNYPVAEYKLYLLHSKMNKRTNTQAQKFNENFFEVFSGKKIDFEKFKVSSKRYKYCFCEKIYIFYENQNQKKCKHGNKIDSRHFIGLLSIIDQLAIILSNKENYDDILNQNKKGRTNFDNKTNVKYEDKIFDITDSVQIRVLEQLGYYYLADLCFCLVCWTDTFTIIENGLTVGAVMATIGLFFIFFYFFKINHQKKVELDSNKRSEEQNIITLALWVVYFPVHFSIYEKVVETLNKLFLDKNYLNFYHYFIENEQLKVAEHKNVAVKALVAALTKDKGINKGSINLKEHGYGIQT